MRRDAGARDVTRCATRRPAMCRNCECDVDGSDGEPMPHIRYAHSEPRGCDVTSGLHAPGSYPPGQITYSLTSVNLTNNLLVSPFHFVPETIAVGVGVALRRLPPSPLLFRLVSLHFLKSINLVNRLFRTFFLHGLLCTIYIYIFFSLDNIVDN